MVDNGVSSNTAIYKKFKDEIAQNKINEIEGKAGMEIDLADDAKLSILSPDGTQDKNNPQDTNISSIVSKLTYKNHSVLFTGDFTTEGEMALLGEPPAKLPNGTAVAGISTIVQPMDLRADILKVAHHGSRYSTSDDFLNAVEPAEAVISVGKDNRYGHPALEILDRLKAHKITIKRTDQAGDIEYDF